MFRSTITRVFLAAVAAMTVTVADARADFRMRIDTSANQGVVITNNTGVINFNSFPGPIGTGFQFNTNTTGTAQPPNNLQLGALHAIDLSSITIASANAGTIRLSLQFTGLTASGLLSLTSNLGGTLSSGVGNSVNFNTWANGSNAFPAYGADQAFGPIGPLGGIPAGSVSPFGPAGVTFGTGPFSAGASTVFTSGGTYSLFTLVTVTFGEGGGSISFDHLTFTSPVPAPAGILLAASALPCFGLRFLRRRQTQAV
jgi:hypothetical protein